MRRSQTFQRQTSMRLKSFFFHYNKPLTQRKGRVTLSVHHDGVCHFVNNIDCRVQTVGRVRKRQPFFVMTGKCKSLIIKNGVAVLE